MISSLPSLLSFILVVAFYASTTLADISITSPIAGSSFTSASTVTITWVDDGAAPALSQLQTLSILLCTGPNTKVNCFYHGLDNAVVSTLGGTFSFPIAPAAALAANGKFYFQLYAATPGKGSTIHYSNRFTLTGMTGTAIIPSEGTDLSPPASINEFNTGNKPADNNAPYSSFFVPFSLQTGATRYAPMQLQPGTKVTHALSATRRFPTSSVSFFTTYSMKPFQVTTTTQPITYSKSQYVNWANVADNPTGYYAASEALSRTINAKSRRGYVDL